MQIEEVKFLLYSRGMRNIIYLLHNTVKCFLQLLSPFIHLSAVSMERLENC
jgi:hypothetical protein